MFLTQENSVYIRKYTHYADTCLFIPNSTIPMSSATYELKEVSRPTRKIQFQGDTLNLENISSYQISEGVFRKTSLILKLKTGESIVYEGVDKKEVHSLFRK